MLQAWRLFRKVGDILNIKDQKKIQHLDFVRSCVEMLVIVHGAEKMDADQLLPLEHWQ